SLPAVSRHLKVLETAGLISRGREAQWRPCRLEPRALKRVDDWLWRYRRFWTESFDRMDAYLAELKAKEKRKVGPDRRTTNASSRAPSTHRPRCSSRCGPSRNISGAGWARRISPAPRWRSTSASAAPIAR